MNILLNGKPRNVEAPSDTLTYEQLMWETKHSLTAVRTVVWTKKQSAGSLIAGQIVKLEEGMTIDVGDTSNA